MSRPAAIAQYRNVYTQGAIGHTDPHTLVAMLMAGVLDCVATASGHMRHGQVAAKGEAISKAIGIVNALRAALDHRVGGELSANLDALYEYMGRRLFEANAGNNPAMLEEVAALMRTIKSGWDAIPVEQRRVDAVMAAR